MSMDDFNCDMLELNFEFAREALNEPAFLEASRELKAEEYTDDEGVLELTLSFGSHEEPPKPHAHLTVRMGKEDNVRAEIRFHNSKMEVEGGPFPPYEECTQWFSKFVNTDTIKAHLHAAYIFDESFSRTINLPFPLVTSEKELAGSLVTGISLLLPKEQTVETAVVQSTGSRGGTYLFFTASDEISLRDFNLDAELEKLSPSVSNFVKRPDTNATRDNTQSSGLGLPSPSGQAS